MESLYDKLDIETMKIAFQAINKSRLQELLLFIEKSGFHKIGIANCLSMQKYADNLYDILKSKNLEVFAINCKASGLQNCEIMCDIKGPSCDPIAQAAYLNSQETELNINVGLCLGHGILFNKHSIAPVTTFVVKDFSTNHNPIEALK